MYIHVQYGAQLQENQSNILPRGWAQPAKEASRTYEILHITILAMILSDEK